MVLFVVGLREVILYAAVVVFPRDARERYQSLARVMTEKYLLWYRPAGAPNDGCVGHHAPIPEAPPDLRADFDFGHAIDNDTLVLWKKLANAIMAEMRARNIDPTRTSLKPAHDLVPFVVSLWNHLKGGEDVFGRILKDCKIDFRSSLNPFVYFCIRFIMVQFVNAHMVFRIHSFSEAGVVAEATSYYRLKQRLNEFLSLFKAFLARVCEEWVVPSADDESNVESPPASNAGDQPQDPDGNRYTVVDGIAIPKRGRIEFFDALGRSIRLEEKHTRLSGEKARRCLLCDIKTTSKCVPCNLLPLLS